MKRISSTKGRRWGAFMAVAVLSTLVVPFAGVAQANHGSRTLDVVPDTASLGILGTHTLTAKLCDLLATPNPNQAQSPDSTDCELTPADFDSGAINVDFEFEPVGPNALQSNSVNDPDNGTSYGTPDMTCSIPAGASTCQVQYQGLSSGTDEIRAWIDHDGLDTTTEADTVEERDERDVPGNQSGDPVFGGNCFKSGPSELDCTDVVEATWTAGQVAMLDCDDSNGPKTEQETNPSGGGSASNETYTCRTFDAAGNLTSDANASESGNQQTTVKGEIENGVNDPDDPDSQSYETPDRSCNIPSSGGNFGRCTMTVTQGELENGTAQICFWAGGAGQSAEEAAALCADEPTLENADPDGADTANDLADRAELTWEARAARGVDAEPEEATNNLPGDTQHTITATVYDQFSAAFPADTTVFFEFFEGSPSDNDGNVPGNPDGSCETNGSSSCGFTYSNSETGRDLVCVWVGTIPVMGGTNQNGNCDGETINDADDTAGSADAPEPNNDDIDVVSKKWVNATPADTLDCEPESQTTAGDGVYSVNCTATAGNAPVSGTEIDAEATGANDPDNANSRTSPDFTCTTDAEGDCTITHDPSGTGSAGTTTYRAWIDSDYFHETDESDASEGRDETATAGAGEEPDGTDVVDNEWLGDGNRSITLQSNKSSREAGKRVRFFGEIDGFPACEDNEVVRLRRSPPDRNRWKTIDTTVTLPDGSYEFRKRIRKTRDYKAVAPNSPTCKKARSPIIRVVAT
ncbi:MAG: hypothetical protein M3285_12700 [Actinomycetota bacterium]|nr:hypothetical protein [Actinomycetota bacterium]